jgi:ABC-type Fe3+/spermidine/putrescine transport system ATPase subunit
MAEIEIREVSLAYDTPAGRVQGVQEVSLDIERSEFLCLVGPSGCGKSTLLNIIAGFAAWCFRISRSFSPGAPRSEMSHSAWK